MAPELVAVTVGKAMMTSISLAILPASCRAHIGQRRVDASVLTLRGGEAERVVKPTGIIRPQGRLLDLYAFVVVVVVAVVVVVVVDADSVVVLVVCCCCTCSMVLSLYSFDWLIICVVHMF